MNSLKGSLYTVKRCIKIVFSIKNIILPILLIVTICVFLLKDFSLNARLMQAPLHLFEPFIGMTTHRFSFVFFSTLSALVIGNIDTFPNVSKFDSSTKKLGSSYPDNSQAVGYIIGVITVSLITIFAVLLASILFCFPNIEIGSSWSRSVMLLATSGRAAVPPETLQILIPLDIMRAFSPIGAFICSFALLSLMAVFYGALFLFIRTCVTILFASEILLLTHVVSWSTNFIIQSFIGQRIISWFSIGYHVSLADHVYRQLDRYSPSVYVSMILLFSLSIVFFSGAHRRWIRKSVSQKMKEK